MPDPKRDIARLTDEIQELFEDLWQVPRFSGLRHGFRPQVDCFRAGDPAAVHVVIELPGVDPDSVELVVAGRTLTLAGRRDRPKVDGAQYRQMEIEYGPFQRQVELDEDVDSSAAHAEYSLGILKITLPVAERPPRPERVPIQVTRP